MARACRDRGEVVRGVFWRGCGWIYPSSDQLMDVEREQKKKKNEEERKEKNRPSSRRCDSIGRSSLNPKSSSRPPFYLAASSPAPMVRGDRTIESRRPSQHTIDSLFISSSFFFFMADSLLLLLSFYPPISLFDLIRQLGADALPVVYWHSPRRWRRGSVHFHDSEIDIESTTSLFFLHFVPLSLSLFT